MMKGLTLTMKEQSRLCIMNAVLERQWSVAEAAPLLGVSERHAWRLLAAYRKEGAAALAHGNRCRVPPNATPMAVQTQVIALAGDRYKGVNHSHLTELLAEREKIVLSRSTLRRLLSKAGLPSPRHRLPPRHRCRRERMPQEGMLVQIDGSHHCWLGEQRPKFTLYLAVDDATGTVPYALFREQEDTEGYFRLMKGIIQRRGIPLALYSDRYSVFCSHWTNETGEASIVDRDKPTQFGRAMGELGVTQVLARSPEAKGRVERANGTFQDRLVSELRLAGTTNIDEANLFLQEFLPRFNQRFGVPATQPEPCYRLLNSGIDVDAILCVKEKRKVAKDNTVRYHGRTLQLFADKDRRSYARTHVEVQERLDGRLLVCYQGKVLTPGEAPPLAAVLRARSDEYFVPPTQFFAEPEDTESNTEESAAAPKVICYADPVVMQAHRELTKAGLQRAREQGKQLGRPRVTEQAEFLQNYAALIRRFGPERISLRKAAKELGISKSTVGRLLDAQKQQLSVRRRIFTT
jgi:transposase